jgi:amidase
MNEFIYKSAKALAQAIREKEVSSKEVVDAYLNRIEIVNPKLNAVVQLSSDRARTQALQADADLAKGKIKGCLHGVPITIKDNIETSDIITTGGTKGRASFIPMQDATVVARMRAAGAIILGKTNLPELALSIESDNLVYGRTNNPYDLSRTPGGSSGGEAAIIAAAGSPLGLGSDAGGSIRVPCHFCGISGIKPTFGRLPKTGLFPPSGGILTSLSQIGPMARFIEDLILTLPILTGIDWRDPTIIPMPLNEPKAVDLKCLRVAFHTNNGIITPTPETVKVIRSAAKVLSDVAMEVEEDRPSCIEQTNELMLDLFALAGANRLENLLKIIGTTEMHQLTHRFQEILNSRKIKTPDLHDLLIQWDKFRSVMLSFLEKYDVIICPVCAYPAMLHGTTFDDDSLLAFSYTMTYNLAGWPCVVVRGGTSPEELPIGIQVVARPWREDIALAVAQYIETAFGGWQPPQL